MKRLPPRRDMARGQRSSGRPTLPTTMGLASLAVRASTLAIAAAVIVLLVASSSQPALHDASATPVTAADGSSLVIPTTASVTKATWNHKPILVFVVPQAILDGVDAARGPGSATPSIPWGPGLRLFALSAVSTHLGCTVGFTPSLGASKDIADYDGDGHNDGRLMDMCHQGQ